MGKKIDFKLITVGILLSILLLNCGEREDTESPITGTGNEVEIEVQEDFRISEGSATINVKAPTEITKVEILISSSDMKNPIQYDLIKEEDMWTGIVGNLPVGNEKTIIARAYNENKDLLYTGKGIFSVIGNNNITIIVQLNDVNSTTNIGPFIESVTLTPQKVAPGDEINLDVSAYDQDSDDEITYLWTSDGGTFDNGASATPMWTAPSENGSYELIITAKDSDDNVDLVTLQVEVDNFYEQNNIPVSIECHCHHCWNYHYAPRIKKINAAPGRVYQGGRIKLSVEVKDKHENRLKYKWWTRRCHYKYYGTFSEKYNKETYFTVNPDAPPGWFRIKVKVCNWYYCTVGSQWIKILKSNNNSPTIDAISALPTTIHAGETSQLNVVANDKDGDVLSYSWTSSCSGVFNYKNISNPKFTASSALMDQNCLISVLVNDGKNKVSKSVAISIKKKNKLPEIKSFIVTPDEVDKNEIITTKVNAEDADGDTLNYSWTSTCSGTFENTTSKNTTFKISPDSPYDNCTINVNVSDGKDQVSEFRNILVRKLNTPPIINTLYAKKGILDKGDSTGLVVEASDPDGDSLTYFWTTNCQGTFDNASGEKPIFTVNSDADYDTCSISIEVSDGDDSTAKSISLVIEESFINTPPEIQEMLINPMEVFPGEPVNLTVHAIDADGHLLTYEWSSTCSGSFNDKYISTPTFTTWSNTPFGNCLFKVTASDDEDHVSGYVSLEILDPNLPPVIDMISANPDKIDKEATTQLQLASSDVNGDSLSYSWSSTCDGQFNNKFTQNPKFTISEAATYGDCILKVIINDGKLSAYGFKTISIEQSNLPPVIESIVANPESVDINESTQLQVNASDPNGDNLFPLWSASCEGSFDDETKMNPVFTIGSDAEYEPCTLTVVISDEENITSGSTTISIEEKNIPPVINGITASPTQINKNESTQLNIDSSDVNGDILNYTWSSNCPGTFDDETILDPVFTASADAEYGECTLSVEVNDGKETTNGSITINISEPVINEAPTIVSSFQTTDATGPGKPLIFIIRAKDPDNKNLFFSWSSTMGSFNTPIETVTENYTQSTTIWTAPACGTDPIVVKVTITDEDGLSTTKSFLPITLIGGGICIESDPSIESKIQASDINTNQNFGFSVAISGTFAISGAYGKNNYTGAAYIYELSNGQWVEKSLLEASDKQNNDFFGYSVDISGNFAIVGAIGEMGGSGDYYNYSGAAYIFEKDSAGNWVESTILHASDLESYDRFGTSVAIDGNYAIVGAKYEDGGAGSPKGNSGCAYIFERNSMGQWTQVAILRPSDGAVNDYFGISVDLNGKNAIIGASGKDVDSLKDAGGAYIFKREDTGLWEEFSILTSSDKEEGDMFGNSVSIDGNYAVIGAYMEDGGTANQSLDSGTVYVYNYNLMDKSWVISAILRAPDKQSSDYFGTSVSMKGKYILIGSQREDGGLGNPATDSGSAYLYKRENNGVWSNKITLYAPDRQSMDMLGISVSIGDTYGILGAYGEEGGNGNPYTGAGAAYILNLNE